MANERMGMRIKELRLAAGLSRERLAARAGVSTSTVLRLERGQLPRADRLLAIATILGTTVDELLDGGQAA